MANMLVTAATGVNGGFFETNASDLWTPVGQEDSVKQHMAIRLPPVTLDVWTLMR